MNIYGEKTPLLVANAYHRGPFVTCLGLCDRIRGVDLDCRKIILHRLASPADPEVKFPHMGNQRSLNPAGGHYFLLNGHYWRSLSAVNLSRQNSQPITLMPLTKKCVGIQSEKCEMKRSELL
jgi:hypothetical protein